MHLYEVLTHQGRRTISAPENICFSLKNIFAVNLLTFENSVLEYSENQQK